MNVIELKTEDEIDVIVDSIKAKLTERKVIINIFNNGNYKSILDLKESEIDFCISFMYQMKPIKRTIEITKIVDSLTDLELQTKNLKKIFSTYREDLRKII